MTPTAANAPTFEPLALADPAFMAWALRVGLRLRNMPAGSPAGANEQAILKDGQPCSEWAQGLIYVMMLAHTNKGQSDTV